EELPSAEANGIDTGELQRRAELQAQEDGNTGAYGSEDPQEMTTAQLAMLLEGKGQGVASAGLSGPSAVALETAARRQAAKGGGAGLSTRSRRWVTNAALSSRQMKEACRLDEAGRSLLTRAVERLGLSARAYDRIRR